MLPINISRDAEKFLRRLPAKHGNQLAKKLCQLQENPNPPDSKKLKGYTYLRADAGEYRIIYEIEDNTLQILVIGKRNDDEVYRKLGRK